MSPFFTLQRQLSWEPQRQLPLAVVAGKPPDPHVAERKLQLTSLLREDKLEWYRKRAIAGVVAAPIRVLYGNKNQD